ncbi:hypothetical protein FK530_05570 [Tsukamurella conjunctivitidis]|uniref:Uncharacterized protein n=1 Tax=Tsukamurella conjunctivitidis TaxID=2592068 RepID=A0A5C5S4Y8_9ACTN|nr:hypothetical protein FK530_05570 [Tsukamurella conjunctivitidis]
MTAHRYSVDTGACQNSGVSETSNAKKPGYVDNGWPQGADGHADHAVNELAAPVVGALSPFGELEFPQEHIPYVHPSTRVNR